MFDKMSLSLVLMLGMVYIFSKLSFYKLRENTLYLLILLIYFLIFLFFVVDSLFWLFFTFEGVLLPILLVILGWSYQFEKLQSSHYMLMYTILFSFPFFILLLLLFDQTGSSDMFFYGNNNLSSWTVLLFLPFFVKLPLIFLHFWLYKAHVEAPTIGSIVLASLLLKLGGYGVLRMLMLFLSPPLFFLSIGQYGMLAATLMAIWQSDSKSVIAYCSVAHMNFMLVGILTLYSYMEKGSIIVMIYHSFSSGAMFFMAGALFYQVGSRLLSFSSSMHLPLVMILLALLMLSNFSVPPFYGVFSEILYIDFIYQFFKSSFFLLFFYCLIMGYLSLFFMAIWQIENFKKFKEVMMSSFYLPVFYSVVSMLHLKMFLLF